MISAEYVKAAADVAIAQHAARARLEQLMGDHRAHALARAQACVDDAEDARRAGRPDLAATYTQMARTHEQTAALVGGPVARATR